jgi:hypothetical protein
MAFISGGHFLTGLHCKLRLITEGLNFLARGTYWSAEQRAQLGTVIGSGVFQPGDTTNGTGIKDHRYRNDCGVGEVGGSAGAEDCSLDMISSVVSAYWIRSMLVSTQLDKPVVYIARGAPRRWYSYDDGEDCQKGAGAAVWD